MPTGLTKDVLKEEFVEMCRGEMFSDQHQDIIKQGIQSYAKLTEMAKETDSSVRAALFYTMSNYLDDLLKIHTKHALGEVMNQKLKDSDALYEKVKNDGLIAPDETAENSRKAFQDVYKTCDFKNMSELSGYKEASEALEDKIKDFSNYNSNTYAVKATEPFLKESDTKKLQVINSLVEKLAGGKNFDEKTFTKAERGFITVAAETAHAGFRKAMIWENSEYFSREQSDQIRLRVNMVDGKENDYSIPDINSETVKIASGALYNMGTENIVMISSAESYENAGFEVKDVEPDDAESVESKTTDELLLDNQLAYLNKIVEADTLSTGKFAVFSLSNSSELPKMTASEFIEKAEQGDLSIAQSMWAEQMADEFLEKLNKNGENYAIDNLMINGRFIEGKDELEKKENFVAAALDGQKLDLAIMEKNDDGKLTSGRTMPIQLNDCMEKSWSFIEWLKSLFGLDRESRVKAANESVRDESKRHNNQERIKMSFDELLGDSENSHKTVKSQSAEKERSLEKKSPEAHTL